MNGKKGKPLRASKHKAERKSYQNRRGCVRWVDVVRKKAKPERSSTVAMQRDGGFCFLRERERGRSWVGDIIVVASWRLIKNKLRPRLTGILSGPA
ncbi:hypothetical protein FH972_007303 [Carpinus fangiana]|uniref:Uncharacterized protein n=1 Tax=Carpinus fangiana TaxID=176857 RepID=A0A5N6QWS8_9ROSI|nr:hypothetical protein FH972_007303 [Carpinus fangiana]